MFKKFQSFIYTIDIEDILAKKPDFADVVDLLADIKYEWEKIGIALKVKESDLGELRQKEDCTIKLIGVIRSWQNTMPTEITWKVVIAAIEGRIVNHRATGIEIRKFLAKQYKVTWVDYI